MKVNAKFTWNKNIPQNAKQANKDTIKYLKPQLVKDINAYVPLDTGRLQRSAIYYVATHLDDKYIEWHTPYARRMYYHTGRFHKNQLAHRLWDKYAKSVCLGRWVRLAVIKYTEVLKR